MEHKTLRIKTFEKQRKQQLASSKGYRCDIIGTTHLYTNFNIFRAKNCCPYYNSLVECAQIGTTFLFNFAFCFLHFVFSYLAMSGIPTSIFSKKMPYPVVGSLISTCVTAPTSFPFWMMGLPDSGVLKREPHTCGNFMNFFNLG